MKTVSTFWEVCFLVSMVFISPSEGQSETLNATLTESVIYSPGYFDGAYANNLVYDYQITTRYTNNTILLSVVFCDIEYSEKNAACADWLTFYDGSDNTGGVLVDAYCCQTDELPVYQSTGSTLYIVFRTDNSVEGGGFKLTYISDDSNLVDQTDSSNIDASEPSSIWERYKWVIVGSSYGALNILGAMLTLCCVLKKKEVVEVKEPDLINAT